MCIVFFYKTSHSLIIFSNRDEILSRESTPIQLVNNILSGRDTTKHLNGMWFGTSLNGKFGFITNYKTVEDPQKVTRGVLVRDYLSGNQSCIDYVKGIDANLFNGFNLVIGDFQTTILFSNATSPPTIQELSNDKIHVISNGNVIGDQWGKVIRGKVLFEKLSMDKAIVKNDFFNCCFEILSDDLVLGNHTTEETRVMESIFVKPYDRDGNMFGTKTQTVLVVEGKHGEMRERDVVSGKVTTDTLPQIQPQQPRRINPREFDPYLSSISDVIDKYTLTKQQGLLGIPILRSEDEVDSDDEDFHQISRLIKLKATHSIDRLNRTRMLSSSPKNWSIIPEIFKNPGFDLHSLPTYQAVVDRDVSEDQGYRILQDKFTLYRDTIQVQLLLEISSRSQSFFEALADLKSLEKDADDCLKSLEGLRGLLKSVRRSAVDDGLRVIRVRQSRSEAGMLSGVVKVIAHAKESIPLINELLTHGDYASALDLIQASRSTGEMGKSECIEVAQGIVIHKNEDIVPKDFDYGNVKCLTLLTKQLDDLALTIGTKMEQEFGDILLKDLQIQLDLIATSSSASGKGETYRAISNVINETFGVTVDSNEKVVVETSPQDEILKASIKPLVYGLIRTDRLQSALLGYKESLFRQLKTRSKSLYPKLNDPPPNLDKTGLKNFEKEELQRVLRGMSFTEFYGTLIKIYVFFLRALQRASVVSGIVNGVIRDAQVDGLEIGTRPADKTKESSDSRRVVDDDEDATDSVTNLHLDPNHHSNDSLAAKSSTGISSYEGMLNENGNILSSATDLTHIRCAKFIAFRQDQNSRLNPIDFYRLFNATWEFLTAGEALCGKMCFGLKGSILSQAKSFLNYFHEEKSKQIALLLDNEQWMQADIPIDFQQLVEQIMAFAPQAKAAIPITVVKKEKPKGEHPLDDALGIVHEDDDEMDMVLAARRMNGSNESINDPAHPVSSKYLVVDGGRYYTVVSVLMFFKSLMDYVNCAKNVPSLTPDILIKIYEFLKLFNSRTCQLILGSAAMRSAGLESITAKHISLTAQSLGLIMAIIPYIKSGVAQYLNPRQINLLNDFDKIVGDYRNHQNELYMHLVNIMMERLHTHSQHLMAINWDTPDQKDFGSDGISVTMSTLVMEICTLHKVIAKYLPPESVRSIMAEVFRSYVKRLEDDLKKIDLFSSAGKNRLLADAHHFTETLAALEGIDGPGSQLEVAVNNIRIKDRRTFQAAKSQTAAPPAPAPPPAKSSGFSYNFGKILK